MNFANWAIWLHLDYSGEKKIILPQQWDPPQTPKAQGDILILFVSTVQKEGRCLIRETRPKCQDIYTSYRKLSSK